MPEAGNIGKLRQNFNAAGVGLFFNILLGDHSLALPHISVTDIREVPWQALADAGFKAAVFDKDNTLTLPFSGALKPGLEPAMAAAQAAFEGRVLLFSNSAGLQQYDPEGKEADALEATMGIPVFRHTQKKPAGDCSELEKHFGFPAHAMVMVGDRYLTDVAFGNRHGMLTVRTVPFDTSGEPFTVGMARQVEERYVARWTGRGLKAPLHPFWPGAAAASVKAT